MTGSLKTRTAWLGQLARYASTLRASNLAKHDVAVVLALVLLAAALRFYDLTGESLWYDETYSVWTSSMNILSPLLLWRWQVEFPLYYWLLHIWIRLFGAGEFSVRALSACAGAVSIWPMYCLGRGLGQAYGAGRRVGVISALLLAVNPYHVWYSQEVRMYALAVLTTTGSLYAFWRILHGGRWPWWATHVLLTGATFHLHYYIGWMVLAQNVYYLAWLWRSGRGILTRASRPWLWRWLLDQAVVLLLAMPAFFVFYTKAVGLNQWGWLAERYGPPELAQVADLALTLLLGVAFPGPRVVRWAVLGLVAIVLAFGLWGVLRRGRETTPASAAEEGAPSYAGGAWQSYALAALTTGLPIAAVFALGQRSAVWVPRYLLLFLPSFLLLLALSPGDARRWGLGVVIVLLGASLWGLAGMYGEPQKEQWRDATAYVKSHASSQDILVLIDGDCRVPLDYYLGDSLSRAELGQRIEVSRSANDDEAERGQVIGEIVRARNQAQRQGGRLWLLVSHASSNNLESALDELPGLSRVETIEWVGIRLVSYVWA